ncbi:hypothetical protein CerSpe_291310 [Prunus speciosa]
MRRYKQLLDCPTLQKKANFVTLGFGLYDPKNDHKVVRILRFVRGSFVVEIYSLKVDDCRTIIAAPSISQVARFPEPKSLSLNGVVYWVVMESCSPFIVSFHLEREEFRKIVLLDGLSITFSKFNLLTTEVFEGYLSVLVTRKYGNTRYCDI